MKTIAQTIHIVAVVFTLVILLSAAALMGPKLLGYDPFIVESGSMEPLIPTGGIAYINTRDTDAAVGDVVTFRLTGAGADTLVTHRIVREEDSAFITKGDANASEDQNPVSREQIIGTYAWSIPKLGFLMAKRERLIPLLAFWVIGLNALSALAGFFAGGDNASDGTEAAHGEGNASAGGEVASREGADADPAEERNDR